MDDRADYYYHKPEFEIEVKRIKKCRYPIVSLGQICSQITDGTHYTPSYVQEGIPFISVKDVREFEVSFQDTKFVSLDEHITLNKRCSPKPGDILLTKVGTIGLAAVVPEATPEFDLFVSVCLIKPELEIVSADFLCALINTPIARLQFSRALKGVGVPDLHLENIRNTLIPLPPLEIQQALVANLEAARAARKQKLAEADALLESIDDFVLQQLDLRVPKEEKRLAFAVQLNAAKARVDAHFHRPEFHSLMNVIQSANHKTLGEIAEFSKETWLPENADAETFRYIEISGVNLQTGEATSAETLVSEAPSRARMLVRNSDMIVSLTRPHHGAIAMIDTDLDQCVASTGFAVIRCIKCVQVQPLYLWCILRSALCLRQMLQRSSGGNYPAITETELENILLPIPSLEVQETIAAEIFRRRAEARRLREEASAEWETAKTHFEAQLLGKP